MRLKDYITEEGIVFSRSVSSKKKALEILSEYLAQQHPHVTRNTFLDALLAREKLGSTAIGKGVAIPHCRLADLEKIYVSVLRLEEGIEFEAVDDLPVTFLFCMAVPEEGSGEQLQSLAELTQLLDNSSMRQSIKRCQDTKHLYRLLCQNPEHLAA